MTIDFNPEVSNLGKVNSAGEAKQSGKTNKTDNFIPLITMNGDSFKKITENDIENAVNEPSSLKAAKSLLANSPIGLNDMPDKETLEKMGYSFYSQRQEQFYYHFLHHLLQQNPSLH